MLVICEELTLVSMEANGVGFCEKLYDIVRTLVTVCHIFPEQNCNIMKTVGSGHRVGDADNITRQNQSDISTNAQMHVSHLLAAQMDATNTTSIQPKTTFSPMLSDSRTSPSISAEPCQDSNIQPTPPSSQSLPFKYPTVQDIFNGYLSVFRRFRAGDHHFLTKLIETMRDLSLDINRS
jgi:hypothetical protein